MNMKLKVKIVEQFGTQAEFAKATGIPENMISRFIRRYREPSQEQKQVMADALGVTVDYIFSPVMEERRYTGKSSCYECRKAKCF